MHCQARRSARYSHPCTCAELISATREEKNEIKACWGGAGHFLKNFKFIGQAATVAQSVEHPKIRSLEKVQLCRREFDSRGSGLREEGRSVE